MSYRCERSQRFTTVLSFCLLLLLFASACDFSFYKVDTRAAAEAVIRDTDAQWSKTAGTRDVDATVAFYSDDASVLPPNAPVAVGKKAIREVWAALLVPEVVSISWQPTKVEVAHSGDIGYLTGTYEMTAKDSKGNPLSDKGKMVEVFRKQTDGKWKCVADIFNSDLPPVPPPETKK